MLGKTTKLLASCALAIGVAPVAWAQDFVCRIEAENATLTPPVKVKEVSADHSGGKYVGDNDPGSAIEFKVNIDKEGTYEFRTHYMCGDDSRGISIRVQNYKEVTCKVPSTTDDWNLPPSKMMSANVYMDAGENTVIVTPYPNAGPNIDCFDIYTSKQVVLPEINEFPKVYEAEDAQLFGDLKVKPTDGSTVDRLSGGRYIGDFNQRANSYLALPNVEVPESDTYRLEIHSMGSSRALSIKVNQYERTIIRTKDSNSWDGAPASVVSTLVYLDKGSNKIVFNSYNDDGPNLDCFKIYKSDEKIERPAVKLLSYSTDYTDGAKLTADNDSGTLANIADNDEYTSYVAEGKPSAQVTAECEYPILLTGYLLSAGINSKADVTAWTVESSADGKEWKEITPSKTNDLSGAYLFEVKRGAASAKADSARFYRLTASGETDVEIAEWQLFGSPWLDNEDGGNFPADITDRLDIATAADAWPEGNYGDGWSETFHNLFDRKLTTKYCMADTKAYTVEIDLGKAYTIDAYTLTSVDVDPDRNPKKWTFNGYNEQSGWVELDRQTEYAFPCGYATMRFNINSEMGFTKFLLDVEDNCGSSYSQLLKWQIFGQEYTGAGVDPVASPGCRVWSEAGKIHISNDCPQASAYSIFNISGTLIRQGSVSSTESFPMPKGIYVVTTGNERMTNSVKIILK